jgi:hypothetical protein
VTGADGDPETREIASRVAGGIASGDARTTPNEELGERAHAGTGYTDEVNRPAVGGIEERHLERGI